MLGKERELEEVRDIEHEIAGVNGRCQLSQQSYT